jgi:hypothetical protein
MYVHIKVVSPSDNLKIKTLLLSNTLLSIVFLASAKNIDVKENGWCY